MVRAPTPRKAVFLDCDLLGADFSLVTDDLRRPLRALRPPRHRLGRPLPLPRPLPRLQVRGLLRSGGGRHRLGTLEAARLAAGLPAGSPAPARDARAFEQRWERFAAACQLAPADVLAPPPDLCALPVDAISRGRPDLVRSSAPLLIALLAGRAELLGYSMHGARHRELAATVAALAELGVPLPDELRTLSASWARPPRRHR